MRSNEFLDRFGGFNAVFSRSDAEQRAMRLRDALLTPRGARGPHAPHLVPVHMARLFIGLTASETAPGAADAVVEYAKMSAIGERLFDGADDFETALAEIFKGEVEEEKFKLDVKEVVICRSWPEATIIMTDERKFTFSTLEPPAHEKQFCRIDYRVGWAFFRSIICAKDRKPVSEAYRKWINQAAKIHAETGEWAAADKWMKENPFIEDDAGK